MSSNRSSWSVYEQMSGNSWVYLEEIYRPNSDMPLFWSSNQTEILLANGTLGFSMPQNVYNNDPINIAWMNVDITFINQLLAYIKNNEYIKIVSHLSGIYFVGKFTKVDTTWLTKQAGDYFDVVAVFRPMQNI